MFKDGEWIDRFFIISFRVLWTAIDWNYNNTESMELNSFSKTKNAKTSVKLPQNQHFLWSLYRKY